MPNHDEEKGDAPSEEGRRLKRIITLLVGACLTLYAVTLAGSGPVSGSWNFDAVPDGTNNTSLTRTSGGVVGDLADFTLPLNLLGCGFAEGAYHLEGDLVGDEYKGTWYSDGFVLVRVGSFQARRQHN